MVSDEARLMLRPFRAYRDLGALEETPAESRRRLAGSLALLLFAIGAFVSFTSAGRLVASHVVSTAVFWSFGPALQAAAVVVALRVGAGRPCTVRTLALYFAGHGPWLAFMLFASGVCLFAPDVYAAFSALTRTGILPALLVFTFGWGALLTWSFFRHGLALTRGRAALGTALFYVVYVGSIVGYYLATNQIQALWAGK